MEQRTKDLIKQTADAIVRVVRKNAFYVVDDYLKLDQDKLVNYNPREGKLEFQLWVPMQLPSIQAVPMPDIALLKEIYAKLSEIVMNLIPEDFSPYDYYYQYKPNTDSIYPPFEGKSDNNMTSTDMFKDIFMNIFAMIIFFFQLMP